MATREEILKELHHRHDTGKKTGGDRLYLEILELIRQRDKEVERLKEVRNELVTKNNLCRLSINEKQREIEQHRWIPVTERLPEESGAYHVLHTCSSYPTVRRYGHSPSCWESTPGPITHWKPIILPEQHAKKKE